jgi:hypothetical protein
MITLRAPRERGDHWVGLEPNVFAALVEYQKRVTNEPESLGDGGGASARPGRARAALLNKESCKFRKSNFSKKILTTNHDTPILPPRNTKPEGRRSWVAMKLNGGRL